tara:strand:- start:735 stop:1106 length:372 start_codon:yes stop_codon:yes gene_type:complete
MTNRMNPDHRLKDPSVPAMNERKKIMFYESIKRQADLRVKLEYDNLKQSEFFRCLITGYLNNDDQVVAYIQKYKQDLGIHNKIKRQKSQKLIAAGKENINKLGLKKSELENIFDIIAEEHPEL